MQALPTVQGFLSLVASASDTALPNRIYEDTLSVSTPFFKKIIDFMMVLQKIFVFFSIGSFIFADFML